MSDCAFVIFSYLYFPSVIIKRRAKKEKKRPLLHFIWQSQGCWPRAALENDLMNKKSYKTKGGRSSLFDLWRNLCFLLFISLCFSSVLLLSNPECSVWVDIFISSRTWLNLGSWVLNYSLLPTDKPGLRSGGLCCHREHKKPGLQHWENFPATDSSHRPPGNKYITMETVLSETKNPVLRKKARIETDGGKVV